jgi:hypothetical protein
MFFMFHQKLMLMSSRSLLAIALGAIYLFLTGWLVFGILLMDYYAANTTHYEGLMNEMPNLFMILISNFAWAFVVVYIFDRWAKIKSFGKGFVAGLIIGFPIILSFDLWFLAGMNLFTVSSIVVDILVNTIIFALLGGISGFILGYKKSGT